MIPRDRATSLALRALLLVLLLLGGAVLRGAHALEHGLGDGVAAVDEPHRADAAPSDECRLCLLASEQLVLPVADRPLGALSARAAHERPPALAPPAPRPRAHATRAPPGASA